MRNRFLKILITALVILIGIGLFIGPTHKIVKTCENGMIHTSVVSLKTNKATAPKVKRDWMGNAIKC